MGESQADIVVSSVELRAAARAASRALPSEVSDTVHEVYCLYTALTRQGLSARDALEVASAQQSTRPSRNMHTSLSMDGLLEAIQLAPEHSDAYIAFVHESLAAQPRVLPTVSVRGEVYARNGVSSALPVIVGYTDQVHRLEFLVEQLCFYDPARGNNPERDVLSPGIILHGPPGTGKSRLCSYAVGYAQQVSTLADLPLTVQQFSPHDYSKWVGESAQNLQEKLFAVQNRAGIGMLILDDVDMLLQSREDSSATHGSLQVTSELMSALSGYNASDRGNWVVLATTNRLEDIDPALRRAKRLGEHVLVPGFDSHEQYVALVAHALPWATDQHERIAQHCLEASLTPAQTTDLVMRIDRARRPRPDHGVYALPPDERHKTYQATWTDVDIASFL